MKKGEIDDEGKTIFHAFKGKGVTLANAQPENEKEPDFMIDPYCDDPELAMALAASLQEEKHREMSSLIPDEPQEGAEGSIFVSFRMPSGSQIKRRFWKTDRVGVLDIFSDIFRIWQTL
jgi:hypothetical protein